MGLLAQKRIVIDEEQDKEKSPPHPVTPVSELPNQPPLLLWSRPFGTITENVPDYV